MKPTLRKSLPQPEYSFVFREDVGGNIRTDWHYHPDYELVLIKRSRGTWLVGDYLGQFASGDVILMGPNLPHSYRHEQQYLQGNNKRPGEVIAALFLKEVLGTEFLQLPEMVGIRNILLLSERGLKLTGKTKRKIALKMENIQNASPGRRLIDLLTILQCIADSDEYELLASRGFRHEAHSTDNDRISAILEYTFNNYHRQITIEDVAELVHMGKHSFCRFFKERTKKTYIRFLMEVRIGKACRLLIEEDISVAEICYLCGYNTISHFNHQFKTIKMKSPNEYKQDYQSLLTTA